MTPINDERPPADQWQGAFQSAQLGSVERSESTPADQREQAWGRDLPSQKLAKCLLTGSVGMNLFHELADSFPTIHLTEVFFGITLAWTDMQAGLVAAEAEIDHLRRRLGEDVGA